MNLRELVLQGGIYLSLRQGLSFVIGFLSVILVTRTIGPAAYGLYAAVYGMFFYLSQVTQMGLNIYLVRKEGEVQDEVYHQAFSLLLLTSLIGTALTLAGAAWVEGLVRLEGFTPVALIFGLGLPLHQVAVVALARLERGLHYKHIAAVELLTQVIYLVVAVVLAFGGAGVWAPVAGFWAGQVFICLAYFHLSAYRPRLLWRWPLFREMAGYGLSFSAANWIWYGRNLVNPVIVARLLGAEAVGFVAVSTRLINMCSFLKNIVLRLAVPTLARLQEDRARLTLAVTEGMRIQLLVLGPTLVAFILASPWLIPWVYGEKWLPVLSLMPFLALASLANASFNLHVSALYVLRRNWQVALTNFLHVVLFASSAWLLVTSFNIQGYGLAELVAAASYLAVHLFTTKYVGHIDYVKTALWFSCSSAALFAYLVSWYLAGLVFVPLLWKNCRQELADLFKMTKRFFCPRSVQA
jgi:O-antigen/teichoic acid export membrane protein